MRYRSEFTGGELHGQIRMSTEGDAWPPPKSIQVGGPSNTSTYDLEALRMGDSVPVAVYRRNPLEDVRSWTD